MVGRVSTASLYTNTIRDVSAVSLDLANAQRQTTSGLKASSFTQLAGNVERISGFQERAGKTENYISSNNLVSTRIETVSNSLASIQLVAESFRSDLAQFNATTESSFSLESSARSALQQIEDLLNVSIGGRYLFSGSRTNVPPIGDITAPVTTFGEADQNYYVGDSEKISGRISDSFELEYGVTANDPALQDLITGIRTALEGAQAGDFSIVTAGQDLVDSSQDKLATLAAKVNLDFTTVASVNSQHSQLQLFWQQSISQELDADLAALSIETSVNTTILQASFRSFATLSQLNLSDFI